MNSKNRVDATVPVAVSKADAQYVIAYLRRHANEKHWPRLEECAEVVEALVAGHVQIAAALEELLDVAERFRGGDTNLDPERWYAARDYALHVLDTRDCQQSRPPVANPDDSGVDGG